MKYVSNKMAALAIAAAIGASAVTGVPADGWASAAARTAAASAGFADLGDAGSHAAAIEALAKLGIMNGYENGTVKPNAPVSRAELAKLVVKALGLTPAQEAPDEITDLDPDKWYFGYMAVLANSGIMLPEDGKLKPNARVTADELADVIAKALKRDIASVKYWVDHAAAKPQHVTRGELAGLIVTARQAKPSADAVPVKVKALNTITLEVTFSAPLTAEDAALDQAQKQFVFDGGLRMLNVPQLKTGSIATYIVPTTPQKDGNFYTLTYKGEAEGSFTGSGEKLEMSSAGQVAYDTFEIVSELSKGVTDYGNVISAYSAGRAGLAFILDENNSYNGQTYEILSSMRSKEVTITPEGGEPMTAAYVMFTQATDGRQAPKFRLPAGKTLEPGVKYTVTSAWANVADASFVAEAKAPLQIASAKALSEASISVTLSEDPKDELFAMRGVVLTAPDGSKFEATYKLTSRKGATGVFELANGAKLVPGIIYQLSPAGLWAAGDTITVEWSAE
ncbi:S-layer homology domain-containing protein [Paenibacillus sp. N4]|uniref:S-layer homology domain-containing protein n=1 Tax=Paenibacillus vietnamensis TaxID=2590547 RepID=UPI001CD0DFE8|nr:S-layer homology domain-containing protein [Paenibacillus vietnamensis]MCA0757387.1 S-layer homology domain-containing protein [Paenibacillus vietnamensis]